jgi:predicted nucleic acid-binding protein
MPLYLDTSALVKLVIEEKESEELRALIGDQEIVSSQLARTELIRAVGRANESYLGATEDLIDDLVLLKVDRMLTLSAAWIRPWTLRSLDALHVASAQVLGGGLDAMVTYDVRMAEAGRRAGLPVASPGASPA